MSKNYELLQQVEFGLGDSKEIAVGAPTNAVSETAAQRTSRVTPFIKPEAREEVLKLVQRLFLHPDKAAPKAVLLAAIDAESGCGWLAAMAAKLLAESQSGSVCLVEGNCRASSLPDVFGITTDRGLADALRHAGPIKEFITKVGPDNLSLLPSGAASWDSAISLNSDRMNERVRELRKEFDYVVMNAPSLNAFADGMALGRLMDGVVLVVEANETRREATIRVTEGLRARNIPILGAVLNNRTFPIPAALYKRL